MRAAYYERNGTAAEVMQIGEVETPEPGAGEVRIHLRASGINPSDVKSRAGATRKIAHPRVIPDSDGAGEIDRVGAGVPPARIGERVWTWNAQWKRAYGTAAEYVVLPAEQAVRLPAHVSFEVGAALGVPALTAWRAVELSGAAAGKTALIQGGAGVVANYAIQFAKRRRATVITTVSSAAKAEIARKAGADHVIDYKMEDVGARVMDVTGKAGADAVIEVDLTANARQLPSVLKYRGRVVVYGTGGDAQLPASFCLVNEISLDFMHVYQLAADERQRAVADITAMLEQDLLIHTIARSFPLDEVVAAHEAVEQGRAIGKVILRID